MNEEDRALAGGLAHRRLVPQEKTDVAFARPVLRPGAGRVGRAAISLMAPTFELGAACIRLEINLRVPEVALAQPQISIDLRVAPFAPSGVAALPSLCGTIRGPPSAVRIDLGSTRVTARFMPWACAWPCSGLRIPHRSGDSLMAHSYAGHRAYPNS